MAKPAFIFDGRNILNHKLLHSIGQRLPHRQTTAGALLETASGLNRLNGLRVKTGSNEFYCRLR